MTTIKINNIELSSAEAALVMAIIKSTRRNAMNTLSYTHQHDAEDRFASTLYLKDEHIDRLSQILKYAR